MPVTSPANCCTRFAPAGPSISAITSVLERSGSAVESPCTSATDCANSALASRNPTVSAPLIPSAAIVPTPGMTAAAPVAAPPAVTAVT